VGLCNFLAGFIRVKSSIDHSTYFVISSAAALKAPLRRPNTSESFEQRVRRQFGEGYADLGIEGFHLPDNLMIVGAVLGGGYPIFVPSDGEARGIDALDVFETCAAAAAQYVADRKER
jgi:hypothetical protein